MSKEEIFNYFYTNSANLGVKSILTIMLGGLIISAIIYLTYYATYKGLSYNKKFNLSLVVILLISIVIMLMISSNIIISLGMVGALSIVRFRTAIKDSRDTVFIFWAIAEGLSVGSQNFKLAIITTLFISVVLLILSYMPRFQERYLLIVRCRGNKVKTDEIKIKMNPFVLDSKLRVANENEASQEMIFEVKTKKEIDSDVIEVLLAVDGVESVNWVLESDEKAV